MSQSSSTMKGKNFERRVASLFSLLGYSVREDLLIGGRQIDLFIEDRTGPLTRQYIVECKDQATPVTTSQYDSFCGRLRVAKDEYGPKLRGIVVSSVGFVKEAKAQSEHDEIELISFSELETSVIDFEPYAIRLIQRLESDISLAYFVEPSLIRENLSVPQPAQKVFSEWLLDPSSNQMTLLGDYGTGKTTLLKQFALQMARQYRESVLEEGARGRIPLLIDLREYTQAISFKQIILDFLDTHSIKTTSYAAFDYVLSEGQVLLIVDGFDEMANRGNYQVTLKNFREINRVATSRAKIVLSCRTHYFTSTKDVQKFHGNSNTPTYMPKSYTDLYREIATRPNFVITYLTEFDPHHVNQYLVKRCGDEWTSVRSFIDDTYNLAELSRRPVLLDMIVLSAQRIETEGTVVTPGLLYQIYTDIWLSNNDWSTVIDISTKMELLEHFALIISLHPNSQMYYKEIPELIKSWNEHIDDIDALEIDRELRTASFLVRDDGGFYRFSHKSFQEFFYSRYLLSQVRLQNYIPWSKGYFQTEIYRFLRDLLPSRPELIPLLVRWIANSNLDPYLRANVIKCFGRIDEEDVPDSLIQVIESSDDVVVIQAAATALGNYPRTDVVDILIKTAMISTHPYVVENCLIALGRLDVDKGKAFLLGVLKHENEIKTFGANVKGAIYRAAVGFQDGDFVAECIRSAPLDSKNKLLLISVLELCESRWSNAAREYCINCLRTTKKPSIASIAFSLLSNEDRQPYLNDILAFISRNIRPSSNDILIRALSGVKNDEVDQLLTRIINSCNSSRSVNAALEVLTNDYPDTILGNAKEWMKRGRHYQFRLLIAKEYARRVSPNGLQEIVAFLSPKERAKTRIEILDLVQDCYRSNFLQVVDSMWENEPAPGVKRHALELLYTIDKKRALKIALEKGIRDKRVGTRVAVVSILGDDTSDEITSVLIEILTKDNSKWVRFQALRSLCSPGRDIDKSVILDATNSEADKDILGLRRELIGT